MNITYQIEPDDFVAFNLSYIQSSPVMRTNVRNTRMISAGIILVGGCILMQDTVVHAGATLKCAIADKNVTVTENRMLIGHTSYPLAISKFSVV